MSMKYLAATGLIKKNINGYEKNLSNKKITCKLMSDGLKNSDKRGLEYFDKIIIMVRGWKSQAASWEPVTQRNIENMVKSEKKMEELINFKGTLEEFIEDRTYSPGIHYAIE